MATKEKETAAKKATRETDFLGARKGSIPYKINAAVAALQQATLEEIAKKAGVTAGRAKSHLSWWKAKGAFVEKGEKWSVSKSAKKAPPTKKPSKPSKPEKPADEDE